MSLKELDIKTSYESGVDDIVESFYIPALSMSTKYDRIAGFFSSTSLAIAARGLADFIKNDGVMRLICCPKLGPADTEIIKKFVDDPESLNLNELGIDLDNIEDEFEKNHVKALGWLLKEGRLEIRLALAIVNGELQTIEDGTGIFHQKVGIMQDAEGNELSFSGSINESATAWLENIEEFKVFKAWDISQVYFQADKNKFHEIWNGLRDNIRILNLPTAVKEDLIIFSQNFDRESIAVNRYQSKKRNESMFNRNAIPLFPYQSDALKMWESNNYRLLFEMATGTGKTRTAIAGIKRLFDLGKPLIVIVSTPQNTLSQQWKDEIERLDVKVDASAIVDGTNRDWSSDLRKLLLKNAVSEFFKHIVLYTTHVTASSKKFVEIIHDNLSRNSSVLFVGDETHWLGARQLRHALLPQYEYRIGLSATPSRWFDDEGTSLLVEYYGNKNFVFSIRDALRETNPLTGKHFLVNYNYHISTVSLNEEETSDYKEITQALVRFPKDQKGNPLYSEAYDRLLEKRANIIKNAENKYQVLSDILDSMLAKNELKNLIIFVSPRQRETVQSILSQKGIIFHKLTEQEGTIPERKFHGLTERQHIITQFKCGAYQALIAIKCLDEGIDIPCAARGILMASSTNPREYVQRIGRIIRQEEDKIFAYLYDICVSNVQGLDVDEQTIENRIRAKELVRIKEIADNAINSAEALKTILTLNI